MLSQYREYCYKLLKECAEDEREGLEEAFNQGKLLGSINFRDRFNQTPIDEAVRVGDYVIIELLKANGARQIHASRIGMQLCSAGSRGDLDTLKALQQEMDGTEYNLNTADWDERTALHGEADRWHP